MTDEKVFSQETLSLIHIWQIFLVKDSAQDLQEKLKYAIDRSDIVLLSGGSSAGNLDLTAETINAMGTPGVITHGIAMKPGKPTIVGVIEDEKCHCENRIPALAVGLPGHPMAAVIAYLSLIHISYYDLFLAIVSLSASPACCIIFADFFLVRRDKFNLKACFLRDGHREYCYTHGFNGAALLSFLAGVCLYLLIYNPLQGTVNNLFLMHLTPTAASSAFAGLFYALLCRIPGVNRYCVPEKRGTLER